MKIGKWIWKLESDYENWKVIKWKLESDYENWKVNMRPTESKSWGGNESEKVKVKNKEN